MMKEPETVKPLYPIGSFVSYCDHHDRTQTGEVMAIEAEWREELPPSVCYTVSHPTYHNKKMYLSENDINGLSMGKGGA